MKQYLIAVLFFSAVLSTGQCGRCDYKSLRYSSRSGQSWTINAYYSDGHGQMCLGNPNIKYSCQDPSGCDYFKRTTVCYDNRANAPCVKDSYDSVFGSYHCDQHLGCREEEIVNAEEFENLAEEEEMAKDKLLEALRRYFRRF